MFVNIVIGLHRTGDGRTSSTYVGNARSGAVLLSRYYLLDIAVQERTLVDIATYGPNPVSSLSSRRALNTGYGCAGFRAARLPLNQSFCPCPRVAGGAYLKVSVSQLWVWLLQREEIRLQNSRWTKDFEHWSAQHLFAGLMLFLFFVVDVFRQLYRDSYVHEFEPFHA